MTSSFAQFVREYIAGNVAALVVACDAATNSVPNAFRRLLKYFASDAVVVLYAAAALLITKRQGVTFVKYHTLLLLE